MEEKYSFKKGFYKLTLSAKCHGISKDLTLIMFVKQELTLPLNVHFIKLMLERNEIKESDIIEFRFLIQSLFEDNNSYNEFCNFYLNNNHLGNINHQVLITFLNQMFKNLKIELFSVLNLSYVSIKNEQAKLFQRNINIKDFKYKETLDKYQFINEKEEIVRMINTSLNDKIILKDGIFYKK